MNYDETIGCSGYFSPSQDPRFLDDETNSLQYTCYKDSSSKKFPINRMKDYLNKTITKGPPENGNLWQIQALWQETPSSITVSGAHGSNLLDDEKWSGLNSLSQSWISSGEIDASKANMWEINNVCDGGPELFTTLRNLSSTPT